MQLGQPLNLYLNEARWALGLVAPDELPDIAADALAEGWDSRSLAMLASLYRPEAVIEGPRLFAKAIEELSRSEISKIDAAYRLTICACSRFSESAPRLSLAVDISQLWMRLCRDPVELPNDVVAFYHLAEDLSDIYEGSDKERQTQLAGEIKNAAQQLLATHPEVVENCG